MAALAMILAAGAKGINRHVIWERLWSRSAEAQARTNLRQALSAIRKTLGPYSENLQTRGEIITFHRNGMWVDIDLLCDPAARLDPDEVSCLLEAGEFLEGLSLNEPDFETWLTDQRQQFHGLLQERLDHECGVQLEQGSFPVAEKIARKLIALDNFNEAAHRKRMLALKGCGEIATALRHFDELSRLLHSELGVSPGQATVELVQLLRQAEGSERESAPHQATRPKTVSEKAPQPAPDRPPDTPQYVPELRNVAVIAVDVAQDVSAHQEDIVAQYDGVQRVSSGLSDLLGQFGGAVISNTGNSFLAVFGYPTAHSKDAERCLRFAQGLPSVIQQAAPGSVYRVAMVSGIVLASTTEGQNVLGDPIRRAQSLLHGLADNTISADRGIYQATRDLAEFDPQGNGQWIMRAGERGRETPFQTAFVGRNRELRQALDLLDDVVEDSRGEVLVLRGEAGIGKTRLCSEIAIAAEKAGYRVVKRRVLDFGQGRKDNSPGMIATAITQEEPKGLNRLERAVWADLVSGQVSSDDRQLLLELDQSSLLAEQTRILIRLAETAARVQPMLLVVEDVHWAERSLMDALAELAASIGELPFAMLFTTRPENDPIDAAWRLRAGNTKAMTLDLQALRKQAALELARNLRPLDEKLLHLCLDRAGGNPLFIEQLILWAEDRSDATLPLSVQSVAQERLDKLPIEVRRLAQAASVLGQVFDAHSLQAVHDADIADAEALDRAHLVVRRDGGFTFVHALVRDGIYASISPQERQTMHLRAAAFFADTDRVLSARHTYWSGVQGAFLTCLEAAGAEAADGKLDTALELSRFALSRCSDAAIRPHCLLQLGEVLKELERFSEAIDTFGEIESDEEDVALRALIGAAESNFRLDNQDDTEALLEKAAQSPLAQSNAAWNMTIACLRSGVEFSRGNARLSIAHAHTAMKASERINDPRMKARSLSTLADAEMVGGLFQSSERHFRECVSICREIGLQRYGLSNQTIVAMLRFYDAEPDESFTIMTETVEEARGLNFARAQMNGEHMLAYILCARGEYDAAFAHWRRARDIIEATAAKRFVMNSACYAAMCLGPVGEIDTVMDYLGEGEATARDLGLVWVLPWVLASKARWTENRQDAQDALNQAEEIVFAGHATYPFEFYYVGIDAALKLGDWARAEKYADRLESFFAAEPVGMPSFIAARARAISAASQGRGDSRELTRLADIARAKGLSEAKGWLDDASGAMSSQTTKG